MNNIMVSLKRIATNKNFVTIVGVLVILALLYFGYAKTIDEQVRLTTVPVAAKTIQPRELITDDLITYIEVPEAYLSDNVVTSDIFIVGKYANVNTVIPAGSMFYSNVLVTAEELPDQAFVEVKDGERPYALSVDFESTYGNSIFPGNKIDVYMKAVDENGQVMVGCLLAKVDVLAVKDSNGQNVFENSDETRISSTLLFGVPEDIFILLKKAEYLDSYGVELFPVPYGGTTQIEGDMFVDREELVDFIESNTVTLSSYNTNTGTQTNE